MLCSIQKYTIKHGQADDKNFSVELCELEKFIGLQIARGVLMGKTLRFINYGVKSGGIQSLAKQLIEIATKN